MGRQTSEAFVPWPLVSEESGGRTGLSAKSTPGDLALHLDSLDTATAKKCLTEGMGNDTIIGTYSWGSYTGG